jgi:hypothetical protein
MKPLGCTIDSKFNRQKTKSSVMVAYIINSYMINITEYNYPIICINTGVPGGEVNVLEGNSIG